jgi:VRR-NUC domain
VTTRARSPRPSWQRQVTDLASLYGWRWAHFRPLRTAHGWRVPVSGTGGAGWPDLVLWRPGDRVIYVELKTGRGRLTAEQRVVLDSLAAAGAEVYAWRPSDFDEAHEVLRRRKAG